MRIVFLCTSSLDDASPRGRWLPIARELVKQGHEMHLVLLHPTFDKLPLATCHLPLFTHYVSQMHVYGTPGARKYFSSLKLLAVTARATINLARKAIQLRPDIIHVCKPQPMNGLAGLVASRILRCPLFVDCDDYEAEANRFSSGWQKSLVRFCEDGLPRRAKGVTVNTRFLLDRNRALGVPIANIAYVPNGISMDNGQWTMDNGESSPILNPQSLISNPQSLTPNPQSLIPKIVYVGTMSKLSHGTDLLIDAFALLHKRLPAAQLVMVGDGDDRPALMAQAEALGVGNAITWVGRVSPEQALAYYADAVCSVDPVYDRPAMRGRSPLKIVESLACGTPVVTSDVGDRRETLLGAQPCGVLVAPGDAQALADGFATLLLNPLLRETLAATARHRAQDFNWATLAHIWAAQYIT